MRKAESTELIQACSLYQPAEIRSALSLGIDLPERAQGAALFADISGFTPLTEALTRALGLKRGAEELPIHIDRVYDGLIADVHRFGGSVIGFAGDAITCWFDDQPAGMQKVDPAALRASACALAMQAFMRRAGSVPVPGQEPVPLSVKVAVASGPVRRYLVGDPQVQRIELIAGQTVLRMAEGEHQAARGEVILDEATACALGSHPAISTWRDSEGQRFALLEGIEGPDWSHPWPEFTGLELSQVKNWVLPAVYRRLESGLGEYLTELRPVVALFVRFAGIDHEGDPQAGAKLNAFIGWVQGLLEEQGAVLTHPTIGDKGNFLCIAFGAPIAHEDDPGRAAATALRLLQPPPELQFIHSIQVGLSQGTARTGSYGGGRRRAYDILGDQVNLAARLMVNAAPGTILVSQRLKESLAGEYALQDLEPITVKGKALPVAICRLSGTRQRGEGGWDEFLQPAVPMVDRKKETAQLESLLEEAARGHGSLCELRGPAGSGKSLLAGHALQSARLRGFSLLAGSGSSNATLSPYHAWQPVFRSLAGLLPGDPHPAVTLERALSAHDPRWAMRLPLLGPLTGIPLPDNATTAALDSARRHEATLTLAIDLLRDAALERPLLVLIEDLQWLDETSLDLLLAAGRVLDDLPLLLLVSDRQAEERLSTLAGLPAHHAIALKPLPARKIGRLLANLLGEGTRVDPLVTDLVNSQAQGNPSFAGQLVRLMRDGGSLVAHGRTYSLAEPVINALRDADCIEKDLDRDRWRVRPGVHIPTSAIGVPENVQGALLARVDRLDEGRKMTLKTAAVIGQRFTLPILARAHPSYAKRAEGQASLADELEDLERSGFVERHRAAEGYAFALNALHEVIYGALPTAQQEHLHASVGLALETLLPDDIPALAHHFTRAGAAERSRALGYLDRAARDAQLNYANQTALNDYRQALSLETRWEWLRGQAEVLHLLGVRDEERSTIEALSSSADAPAAAIFKLQFELHLAIGEYPQAIAAGESLLADSRARGDRTGEAESLRQLGLVNRRQGNNPAALDCYHQAQAALQDLADPDEPTRRVQAQLLDNLGYLLSRLGQPQESRRALDEAAGIARELGDRYLEANILQDIGLNSLAQQNYKTAEEYFQKVILITQEIGCRNWEALGLLNLAIVHRTSGQYSKSITLLHSSLRLLQATDDRWNEIRVLNAIGAIEQELGRYSEAKQTFKHAIDRCMKSVKKNTLVYTQINLGLVERIEHNYHAAQSIFQEGLKLSQELKDIFISAAYKSQLALLALEMGKLKEAHRYAEEALNDRNRIESHSMTSDNLVVLAYVYLLRNQPKKAHQFAMDAINLINECKGEGPENPMQDSLLAFEVFEKLDDRNMAIESLQLGVSLVLKRANNIKDIEFRTSFLENVPVNATILANATQYGLYNID